MERSDLKEATAEHIIGALREELGKLTETLPTRDEIGILIRAVNVHSAGADDYNGKALIARLRNFPTKD